MAITKVDADRFLSLAMLHPVIDVRSPGEFVHAHMPKAHSIPLFDNEERKVVGTAYKQESRQKAIKIGLEYFGKKMVSIVEEAEQIIKRHNEAAAAGGSDPAFANSKTLLIYCWRGGMRSAGVAWLLDLYGFKVYTLTGGYKAFRNWVLQQFEKPYAILIVGGYTGSNKTGIISHLKDLNYGVIDLEALASHRGSAFGRINMQPQPAQEMFENCLALGLWSVVAHKEEGSPANKDDNGKSNNVQNIWLEDESQRIGNVIIPNALWKQMRNSTVYFLNISLEKRLEHILEEYGKADKETIASAILRIRKRLGGLETKNALNHLHSGDVKECFRVLLSYYDRSYDKGLVKRTETNAVRELVADTISPQENAYLILQNL